MLASWCDVPQRVKLCHKFISVSLFPFLLFFLSHCLPILICLSTCPSQPCLPSCWLQFSCENSTLEENDGFWKFHSRLVKETSLWRDPRICMNHWKAMLFPCGTHALFLPENRFNLNQCDWHVKIWWCAKKGSRRLVRWGIDLCLLSKHTERGPVSEMEKILIRN